MLSRALRRVRRGMVKVACSTTADGTGGDTHPIDGGYLHHGPPQTSVHAHMRESEADLESCRPREALKACRAACTASKKRGAGPPQNIGHDCHAVR